jgi:tripartite-type tricarboxylate transporter receptor subunit TctC
MKSNRRNSMRLVMMAAAAVFAASAAHGQTYPDKPIHIVVPFSPGSATDVTARAIGQAMSKKFGQAVIIDNRPGAGGTIGAAQVARAYGESLHLRPSRL